MIKRELPKPDYLTPREAAEMLRLSPRTLERLRVTGDGPLFLKAGGGKRARVLYRLADLEDWIARQAFRSTSEAAEFRRAQAR